MATYGDTRLSRRFWSRVLVDESGCWLWQGSVAGTRGYGRFQIGNVQQLTHRLAYQALVGSIPDGLQLDHLCRVRHCCNPNHLEPVTIAENIRRGQTGQWQVAKTHCPHGHEYTEENTYRHVRKDGTKERQCRRCIKIRSLSRPVKVAVVTGIGVHLWRT